MCVPFFSIVLNHLKIYVILIDVVYVTRALYVLHVKNEYFTLNYGNMFVVFTLWEHVRYAGYHPDPPGGGIATALAAPGRIRAALTRVTVVRACFNVKCL